MAKLQAKFSPSTNGVYPLNAYKTFPEDAVDIPPAVYARFSKGKCRGVALVDGEVVALEFETVLSDESLGEALRLKRNELLAATDWTQVADATEAVRLKYVTYRQALRDFPNADGFPHIELPKAP